MEAKPIISSLIPKEMLLPLTITLMISHLK